MIILKCFEIILEFLKVLYGSCVQKLCLKYRGKCNCHLVYVQSCHTMLQKICYRKLFLQVQNGRMSQNISISISTVQQICSIDWAPIKTPILIQWYIQYVQCSHQAQHCCLSVPTSQILASYTMKRKSISVMNFLPSLWESDMDGWMNAVCMDIGYLTVCFAESVRG